MATVIAERVFDESVPAAQIEAAEAAGERCAALQDVQRLQTFVSADRTRFICVYEAPDAEAVRRVQETAGLPYVRIYSATVHTP